MNSFLQRMLKKSDDELDGEKVLLDCSKLKVEYSPRRNKSSSWIKKLGACSPSKPEFSSIARSPARKITMGIGEHRDNDHRRRYAREAITTRGKTTREEMPDLEKIIREFEMGFLSPTKQETKETAKTGRFVKKIVAAFEEKYGPRDEFKNDSPKSTSESSNESDESSLEDEKTVADMIEESANFLSTTYVIDSLESRLTYYLDSYEGKSSFRGEQTRSDVNEVDEEYEEEKVEEIDLGKCSFAMDEELRMSTPTKETTMREETTMKSSRLETSRETRDDSLEITGTTLSSSSLKSLVVRTDSSIRRERKPKIVGAYLKKPIEVDDDTSIDWIPITGKKLPRKRSFKKLLSMLIGKKTTNKSSKLYCSQMNLREETTRELLHDSGYDEKSCSSSSLVSLVSMNDLLLLQQQQDNFELASINRQFDDPRTGNVMTTFGRSPTFNDELIANDNNCDDGTSSIADDASETSSITSKKLLLEEVPRSELRLSLGPAFPSGERIKFTSSLDRRSAKSSTESTSSNDSFDDVTLLASPLPKHPFISMSKDSLNGSDLSRPSSVNDCPNNGSYLSFGEFDGVELRHHHQQTWKFPTEDFTYDVPRRFISKSEPGLFATLGQGKNDPGNHLPIDNIVYDVPKPKIPRRPRSSVYDDAVSLKRRNANLPSFTAPLSNEFYAFPSQQETHYATIKPRNTRCNPSRALLSSDPNCPDRSNYYRNRYADDVRNF